MAALSPPAMFLVFLHVALVATHDLGFLSSRHIASFGNCEGQKNAPKFTYFEAPARLNYEVRMRPDYDMTIELQNQLVK